MQRVSFCLTCFSVCSVKKPVKGKLQAKATGGKRKASYPFMTKGAKPSMSSGPLAEVKESNIQGSGTALGRDKSEVSAQVQVC